jgi:hypothetical protein
VCVCVCVDSKCKVQILVCCKNLTIRTQSLVKRVPVQSAPAHGVYAHLIATRRRERGGIALIWAKGGVNWEVFSSSLHYTLFKRGPF